jgi:hypothetical protein
MLFPFKDVCGWKVARQYKSGREKVVKNSVKELHDAIGFLNRMAKCSCIASKKWMNLD